MFFKDRFNFAQYGDEFKESYVMLKLLDKNQIVKYARSMIKVTKDLEKEGVTTEEALDGSVEVLDQMTKQIKDCFINGRIFDDEVGEERDMKKEDIDNFPMKVIKDMTEFVQGKLEKKG